MSEVGSRVRDLLCSYGLSEGIIASIVKGGVAWQLHGEYGDGRADLLLFHKEGGSRCECTLSAEQAEQLMNAWEFERRESREAQQPSTFPPGDYEDWTGIDPDTDWAVLIESYHEAIRSLEVERSHKVSAPYLFLCRHVLELQLKAIIMLGQETMELVPDLPSHHSLERLWTAAYPVALQSDVGDARQLVVVRQVVEDYHVADPKSFSFRYPVKADNKPIRLEDFLHRFSLKGHAEKFHHACDQLGAIIRSMRLRLTFREIFR